MKVSNRRLCPFCPRAAVCLSQNDKQYNVLYDAGLEYVTFFCRLLSDDNTIATVGEIHTFKVARDRLGVELNAHFDLRNHDGDLRPLY